MSCPANTGPEVQILSPPPPHSCDTTEDFAPVAQRIEHLTTDQKVRGSNPFGRTLKSPLRFYAGAGFFVNVTTRIGCVGRDNAQNGQIAGLERVSGVSWAEWLTAFDAAGARSLPHNKIARIALDFMPEV